MDTLDIIKDTINIIQKTDSIILDSIPYTESLNETTIESNRFVEIFWSIVGGLFASLVYGIIIWQYAIRKFKKNYKKHLNKKTFNVYWKNDENKKPIFEIKLKVNRNKITFDGTKLSDGSIIDGQITMDEKLIEYGKGYYNHIDSYGFGFLEVQLDLEKEKFYVHAPYILDKKQMIYQAWIWEKKK